MIFDIVTALIIAYVAYVLSESTAASLTRQLKWLLGIAIFFGLNSYSSYGEYSVSPDGDVWSEGFEVTHDEKIVQGFKTLIKFLFAGGIGILYASYKKTQSPSGD